jgi:nucleoside-diphosphate-sugar epimerase
MTSELAGVVAHLGSGVETTVLTVAQEVASRFGRSPVPELRPPRTGDIERTYADISYARQAFGFSPSTSLTTGLDRTVRWFEEHM